MRTNCVWAFAAFLPILAAGPAIADFDSVVDNCNDCHGDDGLSQWSDVPTIAGMPEYVHSDALFIYRDNERPCNNSDYRQGDTTRPATSMCDVVAKLDDATLEDLALYYFGLPFDAAQQEFDASLVDTGKAVHDQLCEKCHSDGGSNPDDEAGILAGQWTEYLDKAFTEFASGDREQPSKMQDKMKQLSAEDVHALLQFYASQQ
jgi:sulfide dehydrogenase cytochrome subunit